MKSRVSVPFSPGNATSSTLLFTISAPAGAGKTTLVHMLQLEFPETFKKTISLTTRAPRQGEVHGVDYLFVSHEQFKQYLDEGELLEWVFLFGEYYGTARLEIDKIHQEGKHCIAVIDVQGALSLREKSSSISIFICPPSQQELERRLTLRGSENKCSREERLRHSLVEQAASDQFDYVIVNDNLDSTFQILKSIFIAEEHRNR